MKTLELLLNIMGITFTVVGVFFLWHRIKYMLHYEKYSGNNLFNFILGVIWFPMSIKSDDQGTKKERKKRINLLLRTLYILFVTIIIFVIVFSLMKEQ